MKSGFIFIFFSIPFLLFAQLNRSQITIDSLEAIESQLSTEGERLQFYGECFEHYKLAQFEVALWAAKEGNALVSQEETNRKAYFTEATGYAYHKLFVMDSALYFHLQALEFYQKLGNQTKCAVVLDAIARIHRKLEDYEKAIWYYNEAYAIHDALNDDEGRARILNERGMVYQHMGDLKTALTAFRESLRIQLLRKDSVGIGYALEFIGTNYMEQDSLAKSEEYLLRALDYRGPIHDEFALMLNEYALGELYHKMGRYEASDLHLQKCYRWTEKLSFLDIRTYVYDIQIQNHKARGDYKSALALFEVKSKLSDSLQTVANQLKVDELSQKYQAAERENKIITQKGEIDKQNQWIYTLSGIAVFLLIVAGLVYQQQKLKHVQLQKESELQMAIQTIENQNKLQELRIAISRDLHDNIGAQLTFIISSIDSIKHFLTKGDESFTNSKLDRISLFTKETIRELRDTIWAMNLPQITIEDLKGRISNFMDAAGDSNHALHFTFEDNLNANNSLAFNSKSGMHVYRIIQEAVNNAVKHAKASEIRVKLEEQNDQLLISITDNGQGFVLDEAKGNGLTNMKNRAEELNGQLTITSLSSGTSVELSFKRNMA